MRAHAKSFFLATRLLPLRKRQAIEAVYAFCRDVDDTVDNGVDSLRDRQLAIRRRRTDIAGLSDPAFEGSAPWFAALRHAHDEFWLSREQMLRLIDGCESDLTRDRIDSLEKLEWYGSMVAGSVGQCILPVLGARDEDSLALADRLGVAMQLTNVLRDVQEDAAMGRTYLPFTQFAAHSPAEVMRIVAQRARRHYRAGVSVASRLPNDGSRAAVLVAAALYERILDGVERKGFDPRAQRVIVGPVQKAGLVARSMVAAYTGFATIR